MQRKTAGLRTRSRRLVLAAIFGAAVFTSKVVMPTPIDKVGVIAQALFLALGSVLLWPLGATFVSAVGGFLTALWRAPLAAFTIAFALVYGLLVDGFSLAFRVMAPGGEVRTGRLTAAVTVSTAVVGLASYYTTIHILALLPRNPVLEVGILVAGVVSGLAGGYIAGLVWKKALRHLIAGS